MQPNKFGTIFHFFDKIPEVRNKLERMYEGRWEKIAKTQLHEYFTMNSKDMKEHAQRCVFFNF